MRRTFISTIRVSVSACSKYYLSRKIPWGERQRDSQRRSPVFPGVCSVSDTEFGFDRFEPQFFVEFKRVVDESVVVATIEKPLPMSAGRRTTRDRTSPTGCNWQCRLDGL